MIMTTIARCDQCEAINQREGTPMGSQLFFINAVAERVEKNYPTIKSRNIRPIGIPANRQKRLNPEVMFNIQLCSIECCTLHAIDDPRCERNRDFCRDMEEWGKICKEIFIWNYNTNFAFMDLPLPQSAQYQR